MALQPTGQPEQGRKAINLASPSSLRSVRTFFGFALALLIYKFYFIRTLFGFQQASENFGERRLFKSLLRWPEVSNTV
jgi:hypothetical protein